MSRLNTSIHPSLNNDVLKLLFSKQIYTVTNFIEGDMNILSKVSTLTYKEIIDIKEKITKNYGGKTSSGTNYYNLLLGIVKIIPTTIKSFDEILDGGFMSNNTYEICGYPSSGKTQLCLTVALNVSELIKKSVYYIDTKCDFNVESLQQMLAERKTDDTTKTEILKRINVTKVFDRHQLLNALQKIKCETSNVALIIVDSLPSVFYHTGEFDEALSDLNYFVGTMRYLTKNCNIPFLLVNILVKNVTEKLGIGRYWESVPDVRLAISKQGGDVYRLNVLKSLNVSPDKYCCVTMTPAGVV